MELPFIVTGRVCRLQKTSMEQLRRAYEQHATHTKHPQARRAVSHVFAASNISVVKLMCTCQSVAFGMKLENDWPAAAPNGPSSLLLTG